MTGKRYYEAKKYANSLDHSHGRYLEYYEALRSNLDGARIERVHFDKLMKDARLDPNAPDAVSEHPETIRWWNVNLPTHVLIAENATRNIYWAFTTRAERIMRDLEDAFAESETPNVGM